MLFTTTTSFLPEKSFIDFLKGPGAPEAWKSAANSLSPFHAWLDMGFGHDDADVAFVQSMVAQGMDAGDVRSERNVSLMHHAAYHNRHRLLPVLLEGMLAAGVHTIDMEGEAGFTPLSRAARSGAVNSISTLLTLGADAKVLNAGKETVLHLLTVTPVKDGPDAKHLAMAELISAGASLKAKDKDGRTALHHAVLYGFPDTVVWLLERGLKAEQADKNKNTAYDLASSDDIKSVLQQHRVAQETLVLRKSMGLKKLPKPVAPPSRRRL